MPMFFLPLGRLTLLLKPCHDHLEIVDLHSYNMVIFQFTDYYFRSRYIHEYSINISWYPSNIPWYSHNILGHDSPKRVVIHEVLIQTYPCYPLLLIQIPLNTIKSFSPTFSNYSYFHIKKHFLMFNHHFFQGTEGWFSCCFLKTSGLFH